MPSRTTQTAQLALVVLYSSFWSVAAQAAGDARFAGGDVYAKVCHYCHDAGVGPVIKGRGLPPEYVTSVVRHGSRAMPAFPASFIGDGDLQAVADYVSKAPPPATKTSGGSHGH